MADPRLSNVAVAGLLKAFYEFAKAATYQAADARALYAL